MSTQAAPLIDFRPEGQQATPARAGTPKPAARPIQNAAPLGSPPGFGYQKNSRIRIPASLKNRGERGLRKELAKDCFDTAAAGRLVQKIPRIGPKLIPQIGLDAERELATPKTTPQQVGAGMEQAAELFLPTGEEGLAAKAIAGGLKAGASTGIHEAGQPKGPIPETSESTL